MEVNDGYAVLNITYDGQQGELPDPINFDAADSDIRQWAKEAIQGGGIQGINQDTDADLTSFVVERFPPGNGIDFARVSLRPKTAFGQ